MVKHNKAIDCNQFRKDRHPLMKTWLNQPARKERRRRARVAKLQKAGGNSPINTLKPFVNCSGQKYNYKLRAGRGFTLAEIKAAGLTVRGARSIKISVDPRRSDSNTESFERNVQRLKDFVSNIAVVSNKSKLVRNKGGVPADVSLSSVAGREFVTRINNKPTQCTSVLVN